MQREVLAVLFLFDEFVSILAVVLLDNQLREMCFSSCVMCFDFVCPAGL